MKYVIELFLITAVNLMILVVMYMLKPDEQRSIVLPKDDWVCTATMPVETRSPGPPQNVDRCTQYTFLPGLPS